MKAIVGDVMYFIKSLIN